jgi:hypothetical protein
MVDFFGILTVLGLVLTVIYFCCNSNAHKMVRRICEVEGLIITILIVILCIGCWQFFWLIRLNPSLAKELSH